MIKQLHFHFSLSCIGEGNGNPLQYSCLENHRDGGAWWAAIYGVAQSRTRLKWLSSSSRTKLIIHVKCLLLLLLLCRFSCVRLLATPWTAAHQTPPSMGFSMQDYWSGVPLPSLVKCLGSPISVSQYYENTQKGKSTKSPLFIKVRQNNPATKIWHQYLCMNILLNSPLSIYIIYISYNKFITFYLQTSKPALPTVDFCTSIINTKFYQIFVPKMLILFLPVSSHYSIYQVSLKSIFFAHSSLQFTID